MQLYDEALAGLVQEAFSELFKDGEQIDDGEGAESGNAKDADALMFAENAEG